MPVGALPEGTFRRIRQIVGAMVYPPVTDLQLCAVAPAEEPTDGVLVLVVGASLDAPHLVHPKGRRDWFCAPWRDGPETRFMDEQQLAAAYRARDQGRRAVRDSLQDLYERFVASCPIDGEASWVVAVARPETTQPYRRNLEPAQAAQVFQRAQNPPGRHRLAFSALSEVRGMTPRRGLRSFTQQRVDTSGGPPGSGVRLAARIEIHADGAAAVGLTRGAAFPGEEDSVVGIAVPDRGTRPTASSPSNQSRDPSSAVWVWPPRPSPGSTPFRDAVHQTGGTTSQALEDLRNGKMQLN